MVQGEMNTALSPSLSTATSAVNHNTNMSGPNSNTNTININALAMNNQADNGEKKKKVGNYIISKTIGEGSFAKVRLGYHLITQQMVAVKVINKREVLKRNYLRANLRREACMMQRMQHPHIIQLFEVMETENCYYIVMELIDGIEFVKYLSKKRSLDENETRQYIRQICSAVDHMHKAKVVHRDIKLQNFMLDQSHNLTIIDFGLSNSLDDREFLNTQCGSPAYAAPEIFAHQDYGPEVDIWSIGVNMYAMLAGKLPFKVENRSKNLAKLHACILKGFEVPPFLSPDCQDLLTRLLEPSPNKRIKMSEIFSHPWVNYNSFPIEIIPYKPVVDIKEIKPQIVQYLVQKHDYSENDVIDAIVYRKPIALKAVYYLIEKRLKQGLSFPDPDYNNLILENNDPHNIRPNLKANHITNDHINLHNTTISTNNSTMNNHHNVSNSNLANANNFSNNIIINTNTNGISKQNSQLLPKRHGVQVASRSSSQKNVDFKSIFNNMNLNNSGVGTNSKTNTRDNDSVSNYNTNVNNSNSPSPDFIAAAMSPIKTNTYQNNNNNVSSLSGNTQLASASSLRTSRQTNYQDLVNRKPINGNNGSSSTINNHNSNNNISNLNNNSTVNSNSSNLNTNNNNNNSNNNINNIKYNNNLEVQSRNSATSNGGGSQTEYRVDRYYVPVSINSRMSPSEDYQPVVYYQPERGGGGGSNLTSTMLNNNITNGNRNGHNGGIRSLPSSIYRGSPERSLPRSPERSMEQNTINNSNIINGISNNRPTTSRVSSSRPSVSDYSTTSTDKNNYDSSNTQKFKVVNYLAAKRSLTSCEDGTFESRQKSGNNSIVKNRQLQMGKAKIDLDTQPKDLNVGVSIKNIGSYLKSQVTRNSNESLKTFNSLNIKPSSGYKINSASSTSSNNNNNNNNNSNNYNTNNNDTLTNKTRQTSNLVHRHSNPTTSYSNSTPNSTVSISNQNNSNSKTRTLQQTNATSISDSSANALPRIRINS